VNTIARNNVKLRGKGALPMIFAHGYGCDQEMWRMVEPRFRESHQTLLFDHVGAGRSDLSRYESTRYSCLGAYAEDLVEICDELDVSRAIFVGHSVGATIGALAALRRPELFRALVFVAPNPAFIDSADYHGGFSREGLEGLLLQLEADYEAWSRAMAPIIMGNPSHRALGEELAESFCRVRPEIAKQFASVTFLSDHRADFARVRHPSLILQCQDDAIAPAAVGKFLEGAIPGSVLVEMRATGHCPHMSAPGETAAAIEAFLHRVSEGSL
jgi:sigma-B regulation protein RsbQ